MSSKIGLAILGAGIFAKEEHIPAIEGSGLYVIKAVYSRSKKSAEELIPNGTVDIYSNDSGEGKGLDDLLAREDIHAVDIVLPITQQADIIKKALKAGKHVISEKPVAANVAEARDLIHFYKSLNTPLVWSVAEQFRYNRVYDYIKTLLPSVGKFTFFVQEVYSSMDPENKFFQTSWRRTPTHQGGFLLDGGVHFVAGLRKILPSKISQISAFTRLNRDYLAPVDTIHATWQLEDGTTGMFGVTYAAPRPKHEIELSGQDGYIKVEIFAHESIVTLVRDGKDEKKVFENPNKQAILSEFVAFGKAALEGAVDESGSPEEALRDLAALEYMLKSGEEGGLPYQFKY